MPATSIDAQSLEKAICGLPHVRACLVELNSHGEVETVHVIASPDRTGKQMVRDVVSAAKVREGIDLDYQRISVVQFEDTQVEQTEPSNGRVNVISVDLVNGEAKVELSWGDRRVIEKKVSEDDIPTDEDLVALTTLGALRQFDGAYSRVDVRDASVVPLGELQAAIVSVAVIRHDKPELLGGCAIVHNNDASTAVARAVLDATNRQLRQNRK